MLKYLMATFSELILSQHLGLFQGTAVCFSGSASLLTVWGIVLTKLALPLTGAGSSHLLHSLVFTGTHFFPSSTASLTTATTWYHKNKRCVFVVEKSIFLLVVDYTALWEYFYVWQLCYSMWSTLLTNTKLCHIYTWVLSKADLCIVWVEASQLDVGQAAIVIFIC